LAVNQKQKQSTYHPVAAKARKTGSCMVSLQYFNKQQKENKNNNKPGQCSKKQNDNQQPTSEKIPIPVKHK